MSLGETFPFKWESRSITYLGIQLPVELSQLFQLNFSPLVNKLKADLNKCNSLKLSWFGKLAVLKMNVLPRLLYLIQCIPIKLLSSFILDIQRTFSGFLWAGKPPRSKRITLILQRAGGGGLGPPCIDTYVKAVHLARIVDWHVNKSQKDWVSIENEVCGGLVAHLSALRKVDIPEKARSHPIIGANLDISRHVCKCYMGVSSVPGPLLLLHSNPGFPPGLDRSFLSHCSGPSPLRVTHSHKITKVTPIIVVDCNDNAPVFYGIPYFTKVDENTAPGTIIFKVTAEDFDNDRSVPVTFNIDTVIPNATELFFIKLEAETSPTVGNIVLNGNLNYNSLSTFYQIRIQAMDRGGELNGQSIKQNTTAYVSLEINDVPDLDPEFIGAPYATSITENSPLVSIGDNSLEESLTTKSGGVASGSVELDENPNQPVLIVSAIDGDKGLNYPIKYSIQHSTVPGLFNIDQDSGEIRVIGHIDREALVNLEEQVVLTVVAQEKMLNIHLQNATTNTSVTIRILDENDNKPQFYNCDLTNCDFNAAPEGRFYGEIEEHSSVRVPVANLTITANDPDKDQNGAFVLYLTGPDADYFTVSPTRVINTGLVQILVKNSEAIDYEKVHEMHVEIVANDTGNTVDCCSAASVTIQLIDINDHIPEFIQSTYVLHVEEHCPDGTSLGIITATDPDSGIYGQITYSLLPESTLDFFVVNSFTGNLTVANGNLLDRERRSMYYATLQARDGMNATGTTLLEISLLDINDCAPEAIGTYNIFVHENTDEVYIEIRATDADEPGNNNSVIQFLLPEGEFSGNFSINTTTGIITSLAPLDREAINITQNGRIVLTVTLYDLGVPSLSSQVNVTVNVEDLNDNVPVFSKTEYKFYVNESEQGAYVGSLHASDGDQTELNNRVSFRISQGGVATFIIRGHRDDLGYYVGDLSLDPDVYLDYEQQKYYTLVVEAQDNGFQGVSNTADTTVIVEVLDLNDEPPFIDQSSLVDLSVTENRTGDPHTIAVLKATDPDTNHSLEFQSLSMECFKNGKDVGNICYDWLWLAPDGRLFVTHTEDIDYELCDLMVMLLRVEDKLTLLGDRYSKNATQRVIILDTNDNAPQFFEINEAFVVIPETTVINNEVASVKAQDEDSGENAELFFTVSRVDFIFSSGAVQQLGNIFTATTLIENNIYIGSIRVASNLDKTLQGQYEVTVTVTDKGDPSLSATRPITIYTIDETFRCRLRFSRTVDELTEGSTSIMQQLSAATGATVFVAGIEPEDAKKTNSRASERSFLYVYCVYSNGTAVTSEDLNRMIQSNEDVLRNLLGLGLTDIFLLELEAIVHKQPISGQRYFQGISYTMESGEVDKMVYCHQQVSGSISTADHDTVVITPPVVPGCGFCGNSDLRPIPENEKYFGIIAGLAGVVLLLLIIMVTSIICMRKSHKRKLRAVKASKIAKAMPGEAIQGVEVIPGTNKFGADWINPMLNIDMDPVLYFEENASISDTASVNSNYKNILGDDTGETKIHHEEIKDFAVPSNDGKDGEEPLAAALNERQKVSFTNTALDTTDL
ncbi:cadherin-related family member 2 [Gastrophryne carolinensis]